MSIESNKKLRAATKRKVGSIMDTKGYTGKTSIFAERLQRLMKENETTQQALATAMGLTRQAISQYVEGGTQPNIEKLARFAVYFDVSSDFLLGLSDAKKYENAAIVETLHLSEGGMEAIRTMYTVPLLTEDLVAESGLSLLDVLNDFLEVPFLMTFLDTLGEMTNPRGEAPSVDYMLKSGVSVTRKDLLEYQVHRYLDVIIKGIRDAKGNG